MAHVGVVILKKKDAAIPREYLELVLKDHQSCMGYAFADKGKLYVATHDDPPFRMTEMEEVASVYGKNEVFFFLGQYPAGFTKEDLQPFETIPKDDGTPALVTFMSGDYTPFNKAETNHSNAWHCFSELIQEDVTQMYRMLGGDIGKLMSEMDTPLKRKQWLGNNVESGVMIHLGHNGQWKLFQINNNKFREFPWGWTTDSLGYEAGASIPLKEAPQHKSRVGGIKKAIASVESIKQPEMPDLPAALKREKKGFAAIDAIAAEKPPVKAVGEEAPIIKKAETAVPASAGAVVNLYPPAGMNGRDALRQAYMKVCGSVPHSPSYKKRPYISSDKLIITMEEALKLGWTTTRGAKPTVLHDLKDIKAAVTASATPPTEPDTTVKKRVGGIKGSVPAVAAADPTPPTPAPIVPPPQETLKPDYTSIIPAAEIQAFQKLIGSIQNDPKYLPSAEEDKFPTFSEMAGLKGLEETFRWSRDTIKKVSNYKGYSAALIFDLRNLVIKLLKEQPAVVTPTHIQAPPAADKPKSRILGRG